MQFTLKTLFLASAVMASAATASVSASAATTVNVPFSFTVGNRVCPAGTYSIIKDRQHALITLSSINSARSFNWILVPGDPSPTDKSIALHFDGNDHNHTLRSIQYGPLTTPILNKNHKHVEHPQAVVMPGQ